jgi:hypothetical protein
MKNLNLKRNYGDYLTAHDLLKAAALIFMILDHVGHFFYPELDWLRIVGRFSAPIWFFLIGYTGTRKVPDTWWYGGGILSLSAALIGGYLLPLNILFTLAITRIVIDAVDRQAQRGVFFFLLIIIALLLLAFPSTYLFEYGTLGLVWAMYGAHRRREQGKPPRPERDATLLTLMVAITFVFQALFLRVLSPVEYLGLAVGISATFLVLMGFAPAVFPRADQIMPRPAKLFRLLGRWTLEIYIIHLLLFRITAYGLYPEKYGFLRYDIFIPPL